MTNFEKEDIKKVAELDYKWSLLKDKTIFISGGTGFLGQFLIDVIKYRNDVFDNRISVISCSRHALPSEEYIKYIAHDVMQPFELSENIDYIIHLASNTHPKL